LLETHLEASGKGKEKAKSDEDPSFSKKRLGEKDAALDKERLQRAIAEEKKRKKGELGDDSGDKRRKYNNAGGNQDVTEEELGAWLHSTCLIKSLIYFVLSAEAYRMQRSNYEDPMANYKDAEI
jgi:hypothetical protein